MRRLRRGVGSSGMAGAGSHQVSDLFKGLDSASSSHGRAVQGGGGAGEIELAVQGPVLQQAIDEARMEDITSSSSVEHRDEISGGVLKLVAVPRQDTVVPKGGSSKTASV